MTNAETPVDTFSGKVFVVDDDEAMRDSLEFLLESVHLEAETFASAQEFLQRFDADANGLLLLDVRMPGMSGLELQEELQQRRARIPVVMMTAFADVPMAVRAMHQGAVDFIEKPFNDQRLLESIQRALQQDQDRIRNEQEMTEIQRRFESLTPREREVLEQVVEGRLNKQIASHLNLSIKTVEQYRARVMEKTEADSLADLVRMALTADIL